MTTRSREYGSIGTSLPLGMLTEQEAFELLCAQRKPAGPDEESAARGIAADLGHHALAVDVAGVALYEHHTYPTCPLFRPPGALCTVHIPDVTCSISPQTDQP